jgi:SAM-dependent methyltransferase
MAEALSVVDELCAYTGESRDAVLEKMGEGIHRTARLFREHPGGMEAFYRESDAYLYELSNNDEDPFKLFLADRFGATMAGRRVLEYGCGIGSFALKLAEQGLQVTACDVSEVSLGFLRARIAQRGWQDRLRVIDPISSLDATEEYDIIASYHVLEHVSDPRAVLANMVDCLVPGGLFSGIAPFDMIYEGFPEHIEAHKDMRLDALCEEAGLEVRNRFLHYTYKDCDVTLIQAVKPG